LPHEVVGAQPIANADRDRLLANRQMDRALDLVGRIERDDPFLDEPDQQRRPEQPAIDRFILHRQMLPRRLRLAWLPTAKGGRTIWQLLIVPLRNCDSGRHPP
jgi:hypothetical protein